MTPNNEASDSEDEIPPHPNPGKNTYNCLGDRCIVARHLNRDPKKVTSTSVQCAKCKEDKKVMKAVYLIEETIFEEPHPYLTFLESPDNKENKRLLAEKIRDIVEIPPSDKLLAKVANTLLIRSNCARKTKGIDTQYPTSVNTQLRTESITLCSCDDNEVQDHTTEFFSTCNNCQSFIRSHTRSAGNCCTCGEEDFTVKLNDTGICMICQIRWLILNNGTKIRRQKAIDMIKDTNQSEEAREADRMITNAGRVTDPRLIPKGHRLASNGPDELLAKLAGRNDQHATQIKEKVADFWKANGEIIKIQRQMLDLQDETVALPQRLMNQLLNALCNKSKDIQIAQWNFYTEINGGKGWSQCKRCFKPANNETTWISVNNNPPSLDASCLIIPILDITHDKWSFIIRF